MGREGEREGGGGEVEEGRKEGRKEGREKGRMGEERRENERGKKKRERDLNTCRQDQHNPAVSQVDTHEPKP